LIRLRGSAATFDQPLQAESGRVALLMASRTHGACGKIGDRVRVFGRLRKTKDILMPRLSGPRAGPGRRGVTAYANIPDARYCAVITGAPQSGLDSKIQVLRQKMSHSIRTMTSSRTQGLLQALAIGDRSGLNKSDRRAFQRSGLAHLLAVSGLHMSVAVGLLYGFFFLILGFSARVAHSVGIARGAAMLTMPCLGLYTMLVGAAPSAMRAALMLGSLLFARMLRRSFDPWSALGFALLVMLTWDPNSLGDVSMQLSFAAVIALFRIYPALKRKLGLQTRDQHPWWHSLWRKPLDLGLVSLAASIGTAPLVARHFHWVSVAGLGANIIATPLASCLIVPFALFGSLLAQVSETLAAPLLMLADLGAAQLIDIASWTAQVPGSGFYIVQPSVTECLLFYFCSIGFSIEGTKRGRRLVWLALVALIALSSFLQLRRTLSDELLISFLPVGQGDAIVIELPKGKTVLIDTGPSYQDSSAADRIIGPFLRYRRITKLDAVFLTHSDNDHAGGLANLLDQFPVGTIYWNGNSKTGDSEILKLLRNHVSTSSLSSGQSIAFGRSQFEVLHPSVPKSVAQEKHWARNDLSLVLRLDFGEQRFLFTGDIEARAEDLLSEVGKNKLKADVLKVAHHGSRSSSSERFLDLVDADHSVISVGAGNRFKMPHAEAMQRLEASKAKIWRTDNQGLIQIRSVGRGLQFSAFKE
jgi:competence protein ComEC